MQLPPFSRGCKRSLTASEAFCFLMFGLARLPATGVSSVVGAPTHLWAAGSEGRSELRLWFG
eukprot:9198612-Prorocentrum_lima.AAC.1